MTVPSGAYVYVNGEYRSEDEAYVSVFDHGFLYGDGVFDTMIVYNGRIFGFDEHIDRLYMSAAAIRLNIPLAKEQMKNATVETIKKNQTRDAYVKIYVSRGKGVPFLDPTLCEKPTIVIMVIVGQAKKIFDTPYPEGGLRVFVPSIRKIPSVCLDARVKSLQYLNSILAKMEAKEAGADDAILLDTNGFVTEGTAENVFVVSRGVLRTPPVINTLDGITRRTIIKMADKENIKVVVENLTLYDLYVADEAFFAATAGGTVPIGEINGRRISTECPGPLTRKMHDLYLEELSKGALVC
jgi:branched-chain amino acid aminotransferase